ncbi:hypothetical protein ASPACDRAFT_50699 [Aspergillus aculeatus ATCC 16872]|uniref:Xylanolytic transcriptional activator regulatory domain-containing protein n=1 Tax=Aspergillus aculeatus (strain ATCC 16872 / CBS 172.66 / WB 5094) TaxID=690307 RepID=A0A1L9X042_ASPA1|nr:uncharacterized protein ASPACDRAFT_50699 [Aspergillus aculeatus ATCC 16872]OJK01885.1 hypothetical protein ASPACDRAFT_50699 [Aspergillus aculeatus ATCC 16872]
MLSLVDGAFRLHNTHAPPDRTTTAIPGGNVRHDSPMAPNTGVDAAPSTSRDPSLLTPQYVYNGLSLPTTELLSLIPPYEAASLLVDTYFDRAHWFMLIFQQDDFRQRWPKLYQRHPGRPAEYSNAAFLSTFLVVIAIGIHYVGPYRRSLLTRHGVDSSLKDRILSCVRAKLLDVMSLGSLEAAQSCVLLGTYYLYHGSPRLAWPVCGCGLRIAQALHLHRRLRPSGSPDFRQQYETRKRCWWAIYEIETFSAVVYGYPHSIWDADCDVEPLDPSAKLQVMQCSRIPDDLQAPKTTLLYYKRLMSELSVVTKAALGELYRTKPSLVEDGKPIKSRRDLQDTLQAVAKYNSRLQQWQAKLPLELQWDRTSDQANYSTPEEIDRDIGATGPRFESHIYQLQAMTLMLAYENAMILTHRPLLSYKLHSSTDSETLRAGSDQADQPKPNPFVSSFEACRTAALRMSSIQSSPILKLVAETYAVTFVSIHTFTAGVTLGILCSMDPLNQQSSASKLALQNVMEIQETLKSRSVVAEQGLDILQRLTKLVMQKELDVLLGKNKRTTTLSNSPSRPSVQALPDELQVVSGNVTSQVSTTEGVATLDRGAPSALPSPDDILYTNDPAMTDALHDFDQALLSYAPQPCGEQEETAENPILWPPTLDGFPILEQTWLWDLDHDPLFHGDLGT